MTVVRSLMTLFVLAQYYAGFALIRRRVARARRQATPPTHNPEE